MTDKETIYDLFDHYDAFYLMIRSTAMLGTKNSEQYNQDAATIIDFIGKTFSWPQERIESAINLILGKMMRVGLTDDYLALASKEFLDDVDKESMLLYELKGRAIEEVNRSELLGSSFGQLSEFEIKRSMGYESFRHEYEPHLRFVQIKKMAQSGDILAILEEAIMLILGIGCKKNIVTAQRILQNVLVWGEKSASKILSFLWGNEGNREMQSFYQKVLYLLEENGFISESKEQSAIEKQANDYIILISAVQSLIMRDGKKEVDMLFADLINREDLRQEEKIELIRRYKDGFWLTKWIEYNEKPKIGFATR